MHCVALLSGDGFTLFLSTAAFGKSTLQLWKALAGWLMGQACSLQPACKEESGPMTLVSAMLPWSAELAGKNHVPTLYL